MRDRSSSVKGWARESKSRAADDRAGRASATDDGATPADENVLFAVWSASRATTGLLDSVLAPAGLTADEFAVYSLLTARPTITPTELARWMSAPATTVSSYVKRFQGRGHVERVPNPDDGRSYSIRLTDSGRQVHWACAERFLPALQRVEVALGAREPAVRDALRQLETAVDQAARG